VAVADDSRYLLGLFLVSWLPAEPREKLVSVGRVGRDRAAMSVRGDVVPEQTWPVRRGDVLPWTDALAIAVLLALCVRFLWESWRRWPDPIVDFGVQLYTAWRLSNGAVLFRDVEQFYGPLSHYLNAGLFRVFGPGLMTLVVANLVVFALIVTLLYALLRSAWGCVGAFAGCAVFVAVFGFAQHVDCGNYNYATPYTHETTHGMLVCLALAVVLLRWIRKPNVGLAATAGVLFGLTWVLKPEIMLAAGVIVACAVGLRVRAVGIVRWAEWWPTAAAAPLPTVAFIAYFSLHLPLRDATGAACHAWLSVLDPENTGNALQRGFMGLDQPRLNLEHHLAATGIAVALIAIAIGSIWAADRWGRGAVRWIVGVVAIGAAAWVASTQIAWPDVGRCLLGLLLLYSVTRLILRRRGNEPLDARECARWLLVVLAAALMARMVLNGRIYQYGFYQAALVGTVLAAIVVAELPSRMRSATARWLATVAILALITPGVVTLVRHSDSNLQSKTEVVGAGVDRFYAFPKPVDPTGRMLNLLVDFFAKQPAGQTLLVLPEGTMLNYLARRESPVPTLYYYGASAAEGRETKAVARLEQTPPDWVVVMTRDLREYGIERYGDAPGRGAEVMAWLGANYRRVAGIGGSPFDPREFGAWIYRRNGGAAAR
jgi:hypothetical protein